MLHHRPLSHTVCGFTYTKLVLFEFGLLKLPYGSAVTFELGQGTGWALTGTPGQRIQKYKFFKHFYCKFICEEFNINVIIFLNEYS